MIRAGIPRLLCRAALLLLVLAGCGGNESELTRAEILGVDPDDPVQQAVRHPARAVAVYWPESRCPGCQAPATRAIERAGSASEGIRVVTVVPRSGSKALDEWDLPGNVIELDRDRYARQVARLPIPRLEVWGARGRQLLLMKRLPPIVEGEALTEEIRSCLSFSSSTATAHAAGGS